MNAVFTASSILALGNTIKGSFPPSYMTDFLMYLPAVSAIIYPVLLDPVKRTPTIYLLDII